MTSACAVESTILKLEEIPVNILSDTRYSFTEKWENRTSFLPSLKLDILQGAYYESGRAMINPEHNFRM